MRCLNYELVSPLPSPRLCEVFVSQKRAADFSLILMPWLPWAQAFGGALGDAQGPVDHSQGQVLLDLEGARKEERGWGGVLGLASPVPKGGPFPPCLGQRAPLILSTKAGTVLGKLR